MHQIASQRIFISKNSRGRGGHASGPREEAFGQSGLLPQTINPIKIITLCESRQQNYQLCKPSFLKNNKNVLIEPSNFICDATIRV